MIISKRRRTFILVYWSGLFLLITLLCYQQGKEELEKCYRTKGEVIDQIWLAQPGLRRTTYAWRPQVSFPLGDTSYIFTDDHTRFATGETVDVLYRKDSPGDAIIYTFRFWIDMGIIVPFMLFGGFIFSLVWIRFTDYGKKPVILKGELDEFTR